MAWDDTKVAEDNFPSSEWNAMVTDQKTRAIRTVAAGVPTSAPDNIGDIYIDSTSGKMYISMGTSGASDWKKVITQ